MDIKGILNKIKEVIATLVVWFVGLLGSTILSPLLILPMVQYFESNESFQDFAATIVVYNYILLTSFYFMFKNIRLIYEQLKFKNKSVSEMIVRTVFLLFFVILSISVSVSIINFVEQVEIGIVVFSIVGIILLGISYRMVYPKNREEFETMYSRGKRISKEKEKEVGELEEELFAKMDTITEESLFDVFYREYREGKKNESDFYSFSKIVNKKPSYIKNEIKKMDKKRIKEENLKTIKDYLKNYEEKQSKINSFILQNRLSLDVNYYSSPRKKDYKDKNLYQEKSKNYRNAMNDYVLKVNKLIEYLSLPKEIEHLLYDYIEHAKIDVYADRMEINLSEVVKLEKDSRNEIVRKYMEIYGDHSNKIIYIETLAKLLGCNYADILLEMHQINEENDRRLKQEEVEKSLFGDSYANEIDKIDLMSGFEFEDYLGSLFSRYGFIAEGLPYSNDYGADLILDWNSKKITIQAKRYDVNNKVSLGAVQEIVAANNYYKGDLAVVITNSYFTNSALNLAQENGVCLIDRDDLERIINNRAHLSSMISSHIKL